jgi:hypothetical protein
MQKASSNLAGATMLPVMPSFTVNLPSSALITSSVDITPVLSSSINPEPQSTIVEIHSTTATDVSGISTTKYIN